MLERREQLDGHYVAAMYAPGVRIDLSAEVSEYRKLIEGGKTNWPKVRKSLLTIMAICYRGLRDLQLETLKDAEMKE
jgi:hypothetical protein